MHRPPTFAELEAEGVVAHRFGLLAGRALVHVAHEGASPAALAADPLNRGVLALGRRRFGAKAGVRPLSAVYA